MIGFATKAWRGEAATRYRSERRASLGFGLLLGAMLAFPVPGVGEEVVGTLDPVRASRVQGDIRSMMEATYGGDAPTVLRFMHPSVVEALGGEDKVREEVAKALDELKRHSIVVETLEFPKEPRFFIGAKRTFALVPTRLVVSAGTPEATQRAEVVSFQVGVLGKDADNWVYLEGGKFDAKIRADLFPDFPAGVELPPISRETL